MSSSNRGSAERERRARAEANAKNIEKLVNELGSHPKIITDNAEDAGGIDELKTTSIPAEMMFPYIYGKMRFENDHSRAWGQICCMLERGLPAIGGKRATTMKDIAIGIGSGGHGSGKIVHQPNFIARHTYNKNWREKAEDEGADISE